MSISTEIARLQQAKSDLATSIAAKGVTVPAATTIDGYAALVDQIQTGGGGGTLPYDAEVLYIQGDGSAYIDTGIVDKGQYKIVAHVGYTVPTVNNEYVFIYGYSNSWSTKARAIRIQKGTKVLYVWYNNSESNLSLSGTNVTIGDSPTSVKADGTTLSTRSSANINNTYSIFLFARNATGSPNFGNNTTSIASLRFYSFRIYNGNMLLLDLIPVRVGTVGYMYDKVSGELFGNANSTGAFTLGPDVT